MFIGEIPITPQLRALLPSSYPNSCSKDEVHALKIIDVVSIQNYISNMHRGVSTTVSSTLKNRIEFHNNNTSVQASSFEVGDLHFLGRFAKQDTSLGFYGGAQKE